MHKCKHACTYVPSNSLFSSTKTPEVLCRLGHDIGTQFHLDATLGRASNGNVKKDDWVFTAHGDGGGIGIGIGRVERDLIYI
jgi:hypothetical protein